METNKEEKVLVIGETEKKKTKSVKKVAKPSSPTVSKTPVSNEKNLKEKLAKASGKTVEEIKTKDKKANKNLVSDYDRVMARNKALKEVHEKMDKDSPSDLLESKIELERVVIEKDKLIADIKSEQIKIKDFESDTKELQSSNIKLQREVREINKDKVDLDNTLKDIVVRLDAEDQKIKDLEILKNDLEKNLKDLSLESKNYRNIAEKNDLVIKKIEKELTHEKSTVKKLNTEITKAKTQVQQLEKSLEEKKNDTKEPINKEDSAEFKALIKEKDKEIRAKERLISNRDKKIEKISEDLKAIKKESRDATSSNKRSLKKIDKLNDSLKEANKELRASKREVTKISKALLKQEEDYKKAEADIAKEYLRLKNYFDKEVKELNEKLSSKESKKDLDSTNAMKLKYEKKEKAFASTLKSVKDDHKNELLKKEVEYSEKLNQNLISHQEDVLKLQNLVAKNNEHINKLQLLAAETDQSEAAAIMQEIKEEVVKNREVMQSIADEREELDAICEDEFIDYQELINAKENQLKALQISNRQYLDEIDWILVEIAILDKKLQDLNDKINSISEKDIHDLDFKRNISEIRDRKRELMTRANEEAQLNENAILNLHEKIILKKADIENVEQEILQTEEDYRVKRDKSYADKLEHEKEMRKLNYTLDLHELKLNELSVDEEARIKNKYQIFVDDYNKRMREYNLSEQKFIEYYLGKTRDEVISKEDEELYAKQEKEKDALTKKLIALKQAQRLIAKQIRDLKEEIFGLKQALEEMNNPSIDDYEESKDFIIKDIEIKLFQLENELVIYKEKLQILNDRRAIRFNIRNKLLMNEQIIFDYAKLFSYLKKTDYVYRQNQTKQKSLNEKLSLGEVKNINIDQIKNELSMLDKEQERLYKSMEDSREKLRSIKVHEKVCYFIELENSIARLKIIENNLDNRINDTKNSIDIKTQELIILKTGNY